MGGGGSDQLVRREVEVEDLGRQKRKDVETPFGKERFTSELDK